MIQKMIEIGLYKKNISNISKLLTIHLNLFEIQMDSNGYRRIILHLAKLSCIYKTF